MTIVTVRFQFLIKEVQCQVHQDKEDTALDQDEEEDLVDVMVQWAEQDQTTMHMEIITLHMVALEYLVYHMILRAKEWQVQIAPLVTMVPVVVVAAEGTTTHTTTITPIITMLISLFIITILCIKIRYTMNTVKIHCEDVTAISKKGIAVSTYNRLQ